MILNNATANSQLNTALAHFFLFKFLRNTYFWAMTEFTLLRHNRKKEKLQANSKAELLKILAARETNYKKAIKQIHWTMDDTHYIETLATGHIHEIEIFEGGKDF